MSLFQPHFGSSFKAPPDNRRPVALLENSITQSSSSPEPQTATRGDGEGHAQQTSMSMLSLHWLFHVITMF